MAYHCVIDYNNHCFRSQIARGGELATSKGLGTTVPFYGLSMLKTLAEKFKPVSIMFADDRGLSKERVKFYPGYKQERRDAKNNKTPEEQEIYEDFKRQKEEFRKYLIPLQIKYLFFEGVEADDIIAYMAHLVNYIPPFTYKGNLKHKLLIVSSDADFIHLVNENVEVYNPIKNKYYSNREIKNSFLELFRKSVLGDKGDSIVGITGVGEGSIEKAFEGWKDIKEEEIDKFFESCKNHSNNRVKKIADNIEIVKRNMQVISLRYKEGFVRDLSSGVKQGIKNTLLLKQERNVDYDTLLKLSYENEFRSIYKSTHLWFHWVENLKW